MSGHSGYDPEFGDMIPKSSSGRRFVALKVLAGVGIVGIVVGLLLPASRSSRPAGRRMECVSNLKNIVLAVGNYAQEYDALPPAFTVDVRGRPLHSWRTLILPYLEEEELYRSIDLTKPWDDPANARALATRVGVYRCPETAGPSNTTSYLAVVAPNGSFMPNKPRPLAAITDPHDATLMVIEASETNAVPWMAPVDADESLMMSLGETKKLHHAGGTNAGLVDGSVRFLKATTPVTVLRKLISISGKDNPNSDEW